MARKSVEEFVLVNVESLVVTLYDKFTYIYLHLYLFVYLTTPFQEAWDY
jgi:hypothetical protein